MIGTISKRLSAALATLALMLGLGLVTATSAAAGDCQYTTCGRIVNGGRSVEHLLVFRDWSAHGGPAWGSPYQYVAPGYEAKWADEDGVWIPSGMMAYIRAWAFGFQDVKVYGPRYVKLPNQPYPFQWVVTQRYI